MGTVINTKEIIKELNRNVDFLQEEQIEQMLSLIRESRHIFTAGVGRSGLVMKAFSMRLMHLGFETSCVGEICSPHSHEGDLLLIGSGSGETDSLVALAEKAEKKGVKIVLITTAPTSTIARIADVVVVIPGFSPKCESDRNTCASLQPMASAFEQLCLLLYDGIIMELMKQMQETSETMFTRHADLE